MNAEVEVTTAGAVAQAAPVVVLAFARTFPEPSILSTQVVASTFGVPSQGSHSISAVAPDSIHFKEELAKA